MNWELPVKTEWMKVQSDHIPSMEYAKDIYTVVRSNLGGETFNALEIGAAWGFSTLAILEAGANHLTSIDPDPGIKAIEEVEANGYKDKWEWNCCRSNQYWSENQTKFDLIYIDGSHLYVDVVKDLYEAYKRLNKYGLILLDDWDHKKNIQSENDTTEYGVSLAAWEFWRDHPSLLAGIQGRVLWFERGS